MKLSLMQALVRALSSRQTFAQIEQASKAWKFTCPCGAIHSIWDIGGMRYRAAGNPKRRVTCPSCKKRVLVKLSK